MSSRSIKKLLRRSRATGSANLAGQCLTEVPNELLDPMEYIEGDEKACECERILSALMLRGVCANGTLLPLFQC